MQTARHYFPGGNTPMGFYSFYHQILDPSSLGKLAVIKGGPGTGKSTFMKQLGEELEQRGETPTYLHCSSDPLSLDGLWLEQYNTAIIDGTAPHVIDPRYPGATDILLNFCDCIDESRMANEKESVAQRNAQTSDAFSAGYQYLKAAGVLGDAMQKESRKQLLSDEVQRFVKDFVKRLNGYPTNGKERTRFLSAISPAGFRNFQKELFADRFVVMLRSETGDAASAVLQGVVDAARLRQADMEIYVCPMKPDAPEHLIFPEANLVLTVANGYHTYDTPDEVFWFSDFCRGECDHSAQRIRYRNLLLSAVGEFSKAKAFHDYLEKIYLPYVDFPKIQTFKERALAFLTGADGT